MKKTWMLLIAFALVTLVAATPVLAGNGNQGGDQGQHSQNQEQNQDQGQNGKHHGEGQQPEPLPGKPLFTLTGTVTALGADSITVLVYNGNRYVKPYFGQELVVLVTQNTRYSQWTPDGCVPIGFGDVQVGDTTSIRGLVSDGAFTAAQVTIDVPCCAP